MRILHCCLAAFYIDNYGYQENILPKIHKLQGHEVAIVASTETYASNKQLHYTTPGSYINEHGIPVTRLPYASWLPAKLMKKIRAYKGLEKVIGDFSPDIIFLHDVQFYDVGVITKYVTDNPTVKIFADGHTDFVNSARNWLSKNILHKLIYRRFAKILEPHATTIFGVTPLRVEFFREVYGISQEKLDLLVLGLDESEVDLTKRDSIRQKKRKELAFSEDDFVIVCGGKIDHRKNIHLLVDAFLALKQSSEHQKIKLLLFGAPTDEMAYLIDKIDGEIDIKYLDWLNTVEINQCLLAADLACFPGTHSVIWEQVVGLGIPAIFKRWYGMEHVDVGGNCLFLEKDGIEHLIEVLRKVISNNDLYESMRKISIERGLEEFS